MGEQKDYEKKAGHFYDETGLLVKYPGKRPLRRIVLARIAERFAFSRDYTEKEVNQIIKSQIAVSDVELIRWELYEEGFLGRLRDGSKYWKEEGKNSDS